MSKLEQSALVEAVEAELTTFLREGTINESRLTEALDFTDLSITEFDRLKRIHFCLSDEVVEFVTALPDRLRRVKTSSHREQVITQGEIRGRINWERTTKLRYSDSPHNRARFACESPYEKYDIPENLVLKKLLWVIHETATTDLARLNYDWRTARWSDEQIDTFAQRYARNVHLNRIQDGAEITITPRMLGRARQSRYALYTEAYTLLDRYQRLLAGEFDDLDVSRVLYDTLVVPERLPRLFELFCVFRLLRSLPQFRDLHFRIIEPGADKLACLENERYRVDVYHDRQGGLSFHVPLIELQDADSNFAVRYRKIIEQHDTLVDAFLGAGTNSSLYSGRPDLVIEVYEKTAIDRAPPLAVVLGEIKYTDREHTFSRGLRELMEYMQYAQHNDYLTNQDIPVHGVIITDGVNVDTPATTQGVTHLAAADLQTTPAAEWMPDVLQ